MVNSLLWTQYIVRLILENARNNKNENKSCYSIPMIHFMEVVMAMVGLVEI